MRKLIPALFLALAACTQTTSEKYERFTRDYSLSDWRSNYVWRRVGAGVVLNAIPMLHLAGLVLDSIYVLVGIDDLILGNGAIIARQNSCDGLVGEDDYHLFFAWDGGNKNLVMGTFRGLYDTKQKAQETAENAGAMAVRPLLAAPTASSNTRPQPRVNKLSKDSLQSLTPAARKLIEKKVANKLTAKIGGKMIAKIIGKAVAGFIPFVGPAVAGVANYWILNDIDKASRVYFREKASIVCT